MMSDDGNTTLPSHRRLNAVERRGIVLRLLGGEEPEKVSRELGVPSSVLREWEHTVLKERLAELGKEEKRLSIQRWYRWLLSAEVGKALAILFATLTGLAAFAAVGVALLDWPDAPNWLAGAGGLGALAFGIGQLALRAQDVVTRRRRLRGVARLAHRACVQMVNTVHEQHATAWLKRVGSSEALDPTLATLRELQHIGSELGGREANLAEGVLGDFLTAADRINPMRARLDQIPPGFSVEIAKDEAKILRSLIAAVEKLEQLRAPTSAEPRVTDDARDFADSLLAD